MVPKEGQLSEPKEGQRKNRIGTKRRPTFGTKRRPTFFFKVEYSIGLLLVPKVGLLLVPIRFFHWPSFGTTLYWINFRTPLHQTSPFVSLSGIFLKTTLLENLSAKKYRYLRGKIKLIFNFSIFYFCRGTLGDGACGTDRYLRWKAIKMGLK